MLKKLLFRTLPQSEITCNICFSKNIEKRSYPFRGKNLTPFKLGDDILNGGSRIFAVCLDCYYSFCPGNYSDDTKELQYGHSKPGSVARIGDGVTPGREYFMTVDALNITTKKRPKILIFAPGFNMDHILIRKNSSISDCKITDLQNFQESEYFVPIDTKETFDIVIACEVIEHFTKPRKEFARLFSYLKKDGLLIASTSIRFDNDFSTSLYPFLTGHTSYYSGKALVHLARMNNLYIDFRLPVGDSFLGKSKRYIYVANSRKTDLSISEHFSVFLRPPSEYNARLNHKDYRDAQSTPTDTKIFQKKITSK